MTFNTPLQDSGAVQFTVAGDQSQPIVAMTDLQKFIIHTASAEYACTGNAYGTITPTAINLIRQGGCGASLPTPVVLGNTEVYVQARATKLRDLCFAIQSYTYTGKDLTIFNTQAFDGLTIVGMAWQQIPDSIIWCVMSNGTLYGLTYIKEMDIWAWHFHSFVNGFVESIACVPNTSYDTIYLMVRRTVAGSTVRSFEQLATRDFLDTTYYSDFIGTDCSYTFSGTMTDGSTLTPTTSGMWTPSDQTTLTSTTAQFASTDPTYGNMVVLSQVNSSTGLVTDRVTFRITGYTSAYVVTGYPLRNVPTWAQTAVSNWGIARTHFTGATSLYGQSVSVLADGNVVASSLNTYGGQNGNQLAYPVVTPDSNGAFVLPEAALNVVVGLPVQMDLQTMPTENSGGETILNKHLQVKECVPIFYNSRDGLFGMDQNHLRPWKQPIGATPPLFLWNQPVAPFTGPAHIKVQGTTENTGQIWVRNVDPTPFAMSGIIVSIEVGDG